MPDKLTDKEIVKGLECCASGEFEECKNCPYIEGYPYCDGPMERDVLDLINRLQAEIKDLQKVVVDDFATEYDNNIKAEAYKAFWKELYVEMRMYGQQEKFTKSVFLSVADKVLKELVGEDNTTPENKN